MTNFYPWNTTEDISSQGESRYETPGGAQNKVDTAFNKFKNEVELPIKNGAIVERHIRSENITERTLAQKAVTRSKIGTGAVGAQELDPTLFTQVNNPFVEAKLQLFDEKLSETKTDIALRLNTPKIPLKLSRIPFLASGEVGWNGASFIQDNLTTHNGYQYGVWVNNARHPMVGHRQLPDGDWLVYDLSVLTGNPLRSPHPTDGHNVLAIAVDKNGYIHITGNYHAISLVYVRSTSPGDITSWETATMTGVFEDKASYPCFVKRADGELLFFYRYNASNNGNMHVNIYNAGSKTWSKLVPLLIDGMSNLVNAYWNHIAVDKTGVIHITGCFRDSTDNRDIFYMRSADGGVTWRRSDGTVYTLPVTSPTIEIAKTIPYSQKLLNQSGCEVDDTGHVHIAYLRRDSNNYTNIFHLYHNGSTWVDEQVTRFTVQLDGASATYSNDLSRPSIFTFKNRVFIIYRMSYTEKRGTLRMVEVTAGIGQFVDFPVLNLDLHAWEPTFDTRALYTRGEIHMLINPLNALGTNLDNWKTQYLGVLSIDLEQIDKIIRKEVRLPHMKINTSYFGTKVTVGSAPAGALNLGYPDAPIVNQTDVVFARVAMRGKSFTNSQFTVRLKLQNLDNSSVLFFNSILYDEQVTSTNKETPFCPFPVPGSINSGLLTIEGLVTLLNGVTASPVEVSSIVIETATIVY